VSKLISNTEYQRSAWIHVVYIIFIGVLSYPFYMACQAHTPSLIWLGIPILFLVIIWIWMIMNPLAEIHEHYIDFFIVPFYAPRIYKLDVTHHKYNTLSLWITFKDFEQKPYMVCACSKQYKAFISDFLKSV
jgi:hypothetical protein